MGASGRPTHSRNAATSSRTWSGELQLRRNRMKPAGAAAEKKSRSKAFRLSPEQPRTTACGISTDNDAPDIAPLQLAADVVRIRKRARLNTVEHALFAEIGPRGRGRDTRQQVCIRPLDTLPFLARRFLTADRAERKPRSTQVCRLSSRDWRPCSRRRCREKLLNRFRR